MEIMISTNKVPLITFSALRGLKLFVRSRPADFWPARPPHPCPHRTVSLPNLNTSLGAWRTLRSYACVSSLAAIHSVVHFKVTQKLFKKHCKTKNVKSFRQPSALLCQNTAWKKVCDSLTNSSNFLLLFTTWPSILNTRSLAALVAIMQNVFLTRSLKSGSSYLWFRHHWRTSPHFCTTSSLWRWISWSWNSTLLSQSQRINIQLPTQNFLSRARPARVPTINKMHNKYPFICHNFWSCFCSRISADAVTFGFVI